MTTIITKKSAGAGASAAGASPAGLASPAETADAPDLSAGSRYINQVTGDYEINPVTRQLAQMPPTRQRVLLAISTALGSATGKPGFGMKTPAKIGSRYVAETKQAIRRALAHLINENAPVIKIQEILISKVSTGHVLAIVKYKDAATGADDEASRRY